MEYEGECSGERLTRLEKPNGSEPMQDRLRETRDKLFFIVGPHRGGTTLLQGMLSSHSSITIPPETSFFDQVWPRRHSFGSLLDAQHLRRLRHFANSPNCSVADLEVNWDQVAAYLNETQGGYDDLFAILLSLYAQSRGKRRAGDKSPRHLFYVHEILKLFPQAKFICLIRDPRAVVRSEMATTWGSKSIGRITRRWCRVAQKANELKQQLPAARFQIVRYEDLVYDPESILKGLCEFLGEHFESGMLNYQDRPAGEHGFLPAEAWKHKTLTPVDISRIDAWRKELTAEQIALIENLAANGMSHFGYEKSDLTVSRMKYVSVNVKDRLCWMGEILRGIIRGRGRRRPWSSVFTELFGNG